MRYVFVALIAFTLGFASHIGYVRSTDTRASRIERHWDAIRKFDAYMNDPSNLEQFSNGFAGVSDPPYPDADLVALTELGELSCADLILPEAPNTSEANQYWMSFVNQHDDIIYSLGNSTYAAFQPAGQQPLHVRLWYLQSAESKIQSLILHLESMEAESGEP